MIKKALGFCGILVCLFNWGQIGLAGEVVIANSGFEEDADSNQIPDNWLPPREGCGSWVTDKVISGKHSIKIENNDASVNPYWQQKNIPIKVNQKYVCTINVMAKDFGQEYRFYVEAGPGEGGWWTSSAKWEQAFTSWQKKNLEFTITKSTVTVIYLVLQIKGKGTIWFDDVEIKPVAEGEKKEAKSSPLEIELLDPSYRNTIYATQNLETIRLRAKVNLDDLKDKSIVVSLKKGEEVIAKQEISPLTKKEETLKFDAKSLKPGRYTFFAQLKGADGKTIATVDSPLRKVEKASPEVRVREDNVLLVNNKPFFPMGITGPKMNNLSLRELQQAGFNLITFWGPVAKEKSQRDHDMEMADKYNLMVIAGSLGGTYLSEQMRSGKEGDIAKIRELVKEDVSNMQGYNNFLGWWIDEPVWNGVPAEPLAEIYRQFSGLDPYHIYWVNQAPRNSIEELAAANRFTDITGSDIYPVPEPQTHSDLPNKTISVVGDETDKLTKTVEGKKPIWMILQGFAWGDYRLHYHPDDSPKLGEPDYKRSPNWQETRFMAYNAIVHGARGILYYGSIYYASPQLWIDVKNIIWELRSLSPVLIAPPVKEEITVNPKNSGIEFIARQCEGKLYLIAINTQTKPVDVQFSNLGIEDEIMQVLFEKESLLGKERQVKIVNGTFSDCFQGYAVHIYANAGKLPEPLVPLKPLSEEEQREITILQEKFGRWQPKANWIWYPGLEKTESTVYARKEFDVSEKPEESFLIVTVDDDYELYINGTLVGKDWGGRWGGWSTAEVYDITKFLKKGKNVVAVLAKNVMTYAGIYVEGDIRYTGGCVSILSDKSWLVSSKKELGWEKVDFKATDWVKATELGKPPVKPWGVPYLQLGRKPE